MSTDRYLASLALRLEDAVQKLAAVQDPVLKECRIFPVRPSPIYLREIGSILRADDIGHYSQYCAENQYAFHTNSGWPRFRSYYDCLVPSTSALQLYLVSLYEYVEPLIEGVRGPLPNIKLSPTSFTPTGVSVRQFVTGRIVTLVDRNVRMPTFRCLVADYNPTEFAHLYAHTGPLAEHFIVTRLLEVVFESEPEAFREKLGRLHNIGPKPLPLKMKSKVYINRAERRAYCQDGNPMRSLAGAILQFSLDGPKGSKHLNPTLRKWYPARDRNKIHRSWDIPRNSVSQVVFGDISSFTNSNVNSWIGALMLLLAISRESALILNRPFPIEVSGHLIEVSLADVLLYYLYACVGCVTTTAYGPHIAPGGSLGVTGNNLLTMFTLVATLDECEAKLANDGVHLSGQLGGDDFALVMHAPSQLALDSATLLVKNSLLQYIGHIKEFRIISGSLYDSTEVKSAFCKTDVTITSTTTGPITTLTLHSGITVPLVGCLLQLLPAGNTHRAFVKFINTVTEALKETGDLDLLDAYAYAYRELYNIHGPVIRKQILRTVNNDVVVDIQGYRCTLNAEAAINSCPPARLSTGRWVRKTFSDRRRSALRQQLVQTIECATGAGQLCITETDDAFITLSARTVRTFDPPPVTFHSQYMSQAFSHARENLKYYV